MKWLKVEWASFRTYHLNKHKLGLKEAEGKLENFVEENNEVLGTIGSAVQSVMEDPEVKATATQALEAFKNQLELLVQQ